MLVRRENAELRLDRESFEKSIDDAQASLGGMRICWWSASLDSGARSTLRRHLCSAMHLWVDRCFASESEGDLGSTELGPLTIEQGLLNKVLASDGSTYQSYELTDKGRELRLLLVALRQWGDAHLYEPGEEWFSGCRILISSTTW